MFRMFFLKKRSAKGSLDGKCFGTTAGSSLRLFSCSMVCLLYWLCSHTATGASFNVKPTRVFLYKSHVSETLKIRNTSGRTLSFQLNAVEWTQDAEGKDKEINTGEVVFFPKLFTLQAGKTRLVRVGLVNPEPAKKQKTFRIYIRELPQGDSSSRTMLKVLLRVGVPVFLAPRVERTTAKVEEIRIEDCRVVYTVKNSGTVHLKIKSNKVTAYNKKGKKIFAEEISGYYLLSGVRRTSRFKLDADICRHVDKLKVHIESDAIDIDSEKTSLISEK